MTGLIDISILVTALGWTLVHFLWQGAMLAGLMWLVYRLIPHQRSQLRYLTGLGFYFLLLPVAINTFIFFYKSIPLVSIPAATQLPMVSVATGVQPDFAFWLNEGIEPLLPLIVLLWAVGVSLLSMKTLFAWITTRRLVKNNVSAISAELQQRVELLLKRLRVRQTVSVLVSSRVLVPTVIGWLKPVILLPVGVLARLPMSQMEMVIAHELGHIQRYDYFVNLMQVILDTLFFYHPGVRWMSRRIRQEREHCCDDFVLSHHCRPSLYARALANLEIIRQPELATTLAATGGDLLQRVHRIANIESPRKNGGFAQVAMMTTLVALAGLGAKSGLEIDPAPSQDQISGGVAEMDTNRISVAATGRDDWMSGVNPYGRISTGIESSNKRKQQRAEQQLLDQQLKERQYTAQSQAVVNSKPIFSLPEPVLTDSSLASLDRKPLVTPDDPWVAAATVKEKPRATVKAIKTVSPRYPSFARSRALEGWVKLSFSVDERGRARNVEVLSAEPHQTFDRAAEKALRKWRFEILPGHDSSKRLLQTFDFSLHPSDDRTSGRQRRCSTTGSNICGMFYRQESVETYGSQSARLQASNKK